MILIVIIAPIKHFFVNYYLLDIAVRLFTNDGKKEIIFEQIRLKIAMIRKKNPIFLIKNTLSGNFHKI